MTVRLASAESPSEVRLTGEELAARGATDLASALRLLPDLVVNYEGSLGSVARIHGADASQVRVVIDGVVVRDPMYGVLDLSSIPITDVVEIRVDTAPGSPLDGPGASGGVIEVRTRDPAGVEASTARATLDSRPRVGVSAAGNVALTKQMSLRMSASSLLGFEPIALRGEPVKSQDLRATTGSLRFEYRKDTRRVVIDGDIGDRRFFRGYTSLILYRPMLLLAQETAGRVALDAVDDRGARGALQIQGWLQSTKRRDRYFRNVDIHDEIGDLARSTLRAGASARLTRPFADLAYGVGAVTLDHEEVRETNEWNTSAGTTREARSGHMTLVELAAGAGFETSRWRLRSVGGIVAHIGPGRDPVPEGELRARYRTSKVSLEAIVARKTETEELWFHLYLPQFLIDGLPVLHAELRTVATLPRGVEVTLAPYQRRTDIAVVGLPGVGTRSISTRGIDVRARAILHRIVEIGGAYEYGEVFSSTFRPDDFPDTLAEVWLHVGPTHGISLHTRARYVILSDTPTYALWDTSASYQTRSGWLATLRGDDLLDATPDTREGDDVIGRSISLLVQRTWI